MAELKAYPLRNTLEELAMKGARAPLSLKAVSAGEADNSLIRESARLSLLLAATLFFWLAFPKPILAQTTLFNAQSQFVSGFNPSCIVVDDFNGDRVQDLAVVNFGSATVSVLLGNGDGTFQAAQTFAVGSFPSRLWPHKSRGRHCRVVRGADHGNS